jgi:hypothetical protein
MPKTDFIRRLHTANLISFCFGLGLLFPFSITYASSYLHNSFKNAGGPWLFLPLCYGAATSVLHLIRLRLKAQPSLWENLATSFWNFALFTGYMVALCVTWIRDPPNFESQLRLLQLECFATVPMMFNM